MSAAISIRDDAPPVIAAHPAVALVNMPWAMLRAPSIQLSTIKSLLAQRKIATRVFNFNLDWMQCLADAGFKVREYVEIAQASRGLGEFVFAVAPFREATPADDEAFRKLFVDSDAADQKLFEQAVKMRALVPAFLGRCVDRLVASEARVVGFTTTFQQNVPALGLAQALKQRAPAIVTVFGGANCDGVMGETLHRSFPFIDVVVRGEAEAIVGPLFGELAAAAPVSPHPGICYRADGERIVVPQKGPLPQMSDVPMPDHDDYFRDLPLTTFEGDVAPVWIPFESARGCWWGQKHHCTFCGLNGTSMKFRSKSAQRTYDEIMTMAKRHQVTHFNATDNIIEMGYFEELLPELAKSGLDLLVFYETKANLKKAQVAAMAAAGVYIIQPGIESLDTSVLTLMKKGTTTLQNIRLMKWAREYRIDVAWNLIFGFPGEDPEAYARMADLVPSLVHFQPPDSSMLEVHRFSPYHASTAQFPLKVTGPKAFYRHVYPLDDATLSDIAYAFAYEYTTPQDPYAYSRPLAEALETWRKAWPTAKLEMRRGPDFIEIEDTRFASRAVHRLGAMEAKIYALLDASATPGAVAHELAKTAKHGETVPSVPEIETFLKELLLLKIVYEEDGRYLSLASPARPLR